MRLVITGGSGFIGKAAHDRALVLDHEVTVFDRHLGMDVTDPRALTDAFSTNDVVIHLAGVLGTAELYEDVDRAVDVNLKGTIKVLSACRDLGLAYVGITMPDVWANLYQATKIAAQRVALGFHRDFGVPVTHIRAFNAYGYGQAYGPGHPQKIIPTFASRSWRHEPMPIWGDGEQLVDLVHVTDVAHRLIGAAELSLELDPRVGKGQVYDAGSGRCVPVIEVAREVGRITGSALVEFLPMRRGETPGTEVRAVDFGPWPYEWTIEQDLARLRDVVEWYKP